MSVQEKMTAIADAIRAKTGGTAPLTLDGMALGVPAVYEKGVEAAENVCTERHFAYAFVGDGTATATFTVPFEPDVLVVSGAYPFHATDLGDNMTALLWFDLRAFGMLGGLSLFGKSSASSKMQYSMLTTTSLLNRYNRAADGTVTLTCISTSLFSKGVTYMVSAAKMLDKTDKKRITEFVLGLTGSGSVTLNRAKVNAAFTDDEWAVLIAQVPGWTFSFI